MRSPRQGKEGAYLSRSCFSSCAASSPPDRNKEYLQPRSLFCYMGTYALTLFTWKTQTGSLLLRKQRLSSERPELTQVLLSRPGAHRPLHISSNGQ